MTFCIFLKHLISLDSNMIFIIFRFYKILFFLIQKKLERKVLNIIRFHEFLHHLILKLYILFLLITSKIYILSYKKHLFQTAPEMSRKIQK